MAAVELHVAPFLVAFATWSLFSVCAIAFAVRYRRRARRAGQLTKAERAQFDQIAAHARSAQGWLNHPDDPKT